MPTPGPCPPQVSSADEGRIKELQRSVSNEKVALLDLKDQCAGLEKQAASLQVGVWGEGRQSTSKRE